MATQRLPRRFGTTCASAIKFESTDDGEVLLVFRYQGKVVHSEMHFRSNGDFTPVPEEALSPNPPSSRSWLKARGPAVKGD